MPTASLRRIFHRDHRVFQGPTLTFGPREQAEQRANAVLQNARRLDDIDIFEPAPPVPGVLCQTHQRRAGDHFLSNIDLIDGSDPEESAKVEKRRGSAPTNINLRKSYLLQIAEKMPKGAHLHIHFNATLLPHVLLEKAERMPNMYIWSNVPLVTKQDLDLCEIQFSLGERKDPDASDPDGRDEKQVQETYSRLYAEDDLTGPNLFSEKYEKDSRMRYAFFRQEWDVQKAKLQELSKQLGGLSDELQGTLDILQGGCRNWLISKLVFHADEAHNAQQTQDGIWEKFNGRTRMMKGLFNYETAFREYTRDCLEEFVRENVQYAEIRPNFMKSNQIWTDDGKAKIDNEGTMQIIVDEYERFMKTKGVMSPDGRIVENRPLNAQGKVVYQSSANADQPLTPQQKTKILDDRRREKPVLTPRLAFGGLKVIYCTPRSFPREEVKEMLAECLKFKRKWPQYIAGFDLVGEESKGHPLSFFQKEFEEFVATCRKEKVEIPFLFHCGETHYDPDDNLGTALSFDTTKRIGHGYALLSETGYDDRMKSKGICVESCPISNEILGLNSRIAEHAIYGLINRGLHCTLNSDNGTLFRSTLSHDFYQYIVGRKDGQKKTTLQQCRQLIQWSIDHACMTQEERERVQVEWELRWDEFLDWVNKVPEFQVKKPTRAEVAAMEAVAERKAKEEEGKRKAAETASQALPTGQAANAKL
ncbi:hypothetical protein DL769_008853 [Monosporascus sp. CRB-8-3]|nr:hypothetical protein DL769_008853 [Monosporascus sp. CRB-8-3]